jgi:hypothetical protein
LSADAFKVTAFFCEERYIASIKTGDRTDKISWASLRKYWTNASADNIEYVCYSIKGIYLVFCMSVAQGQDGIICVWDT